MFRHVFLTLLLICDKAASPNNRSRSVKPTRVGVFRWDTSFCTTSTPAPLIYPT